jgi:hypothetical protein
MRNIEKYKDIIIDNTDVCSINRLLLKKNIKGFCSGYSCEGCKERAIKWLLEEYEEPVLDEVERKYLSDVIKPFGHRVSYIVKRKNGSAYYIAIIVNNFDVMNLPYFTRNTMYKGMTVGRNYKLKELGL